jgi:hypothetical protein
MKRREPGTPIPQGEARETNSDHTLVTKILDLVVTDTLTTVHLTYNNKTLFINASYQKEFPDKTRNALTRLQKKDARLTVTTPSITSISLRINTIDLVPKFFQSLASDKVTVYS